MVDINLAAIWNSTVREPIEHYNVYKIKGLLLLECSHKWNEKWMTGCLTFGDVPEATLCEIAMLINCCYDDSQWLVYFDSGPV